MRRRARQRPVPSDLHRECQLVGLCGNGEVDDGEECDDGVEEREENGDYLRGNHLNAACTPGCAFNRCGDGGFYVYERADQENPNGIEECEDGNVEPGDGCDEECREEN